MGKLSSACLQTDRLTVKSADTQYSCNTEIRDANYNMGHLICTYMIHQTQLLPFKTCNWRVLMAYNVSMVIGGLEAYVAIKLIGFLGYQLWHFGISGYFGEVFSIHYQVTVITKCAFKDAEVQIALTAGDRNASKLQFFFFFFFFFLHSYHASWKYQSFLFTNECTSDCLKNNIKIYTKMAPFFQ